MAGYTRQSTFADGDTITAALFNNEFNQLLNAFGNTSGHKHDGTANEGPVIGLIGDAGETSPNNKVLIDTTNNYIEFYVEVSSAPVQQLYIADGAIIPVTDSDIDLGTTSLRFKDTYTDTVTTTGNVSIGGDLTVTGSATISGNLTFGDADTDSINLAAEIDSDIIPNTDGTYDLGSATKEWQDLYIDGTANIDSLVADTADINGGTIDGATIATSDITVGAGKTLDVSSGTLTLADDQISGDKVEGGTIAATTITSLTATSADINGGTIDGSTIATSNITVGTGKTLDVSSGTLTLADNQISGDKVEGGTIAATTITDLTFDSLNDGTITVTAFADEDDMSSNSATLLPTQQSVKAYVDSQVTAQDLDFQGDTGGALSIDLDSESLTIAGGTGLDTVGSGNTVTVNIDSTVATLTGTQTLTNKTLTSPDVNTPDIDGGTIDGTVIGGATPAAGTFTTLTANTSLTGTLATAAQPNITSLGTLTGLTTSGDINFGDNDKAVFGAGSDLQIYHDGSNSFVQDTGTGDLYLQGSSNIFFRKGDGGEVFAHFADDGACKLRFDNSTKFQTTSTGIDVTGTATMDGLTVDGTGSFTQSSNAATALTTFTNSNAGASARTSISFASDTGSSVVGTVSSGWTVDALNANETFMYGSHGVSLFAPASQNVRILAGGSERLRVDSSGNVGIGVTSPNQKLNVSGGRSYFGANNEAYAIGVGYNGTRTAANQTYFIGATDATAPDLQFSNSDGGEKVRITHSGNVGIGTTSPNSTAGFTTVTLNNATSGGIIDFENNTSLVGRIYNTSTNFHVYNQTANSLLFGTGGAEKMRIDSSGNVGINTTSFASSNRKFVITDTSATFYQSLIGSTTASAGILFGDTDSHTQGRITYDNSSDNLQFWSNNQEAMRIDSSGNLLVGTTDNVAHVTSSSGEGIALSAGSYGGFIGATRNQDVVMQLNRTGNDGDIVRFAKDGTTVGTIGVASNDNLYIAGGSGNTKGLYFNDGAVVPAAQGGSPSDNTVDLGQSGIRFKDLYLSGGAYIGGTGSANQLDDYEEGTYTPTFSVTSGTPSYNYQQAYYTKIGRQVYGGGIIGVTNANTLGGAIKFSLPFTVDCGNLGVAGAWFSDGSGFDFPLTTDSGDEVYTLYGQAPDGSTSIEMIAVETNSGSLRYSDVGTTMYFRFGFSYPTS